MGLPITAFWLLNSCINRIQAEKDIRSLKVASSVNDGEQFRAIQESLVIELGEVMKIDPIASAERDEAGFEELRTMVAR